jgi:ribosome-interacting GTPase 1
MPTNLTPEYRRVEAAYRKASDPAEKLTLLKQMLSVMPKHKGTDHLQAEVKSRIKELIGELRSPGKAKRGGPSHVLRPEGAAQIALIGPPNTGKSALHAKLTGSHAMIGPYPYTTAEPLPGMLTFEDVHLQLVDLPPISREHPLPWIVDALQPADACLLVIDLSANDCVEACADVIDLLRERRIRLTPEWSLAPPDEEAGTDPFALTLPALVVVNKCDLLDDVAGEVGVFLELLGTEFPWLAVSVETGERLDEIGAWLFRALEIVRVYTKTPGKPADADKPFTVRRGETVRDVARQVHQEFGERIKFARIWGSETFDGQQVGPEHPVVDRDVVEIHV